MNKIYTGIGSRNTPPEILEKMYNISSKLAEKGYTLRSGHADGADLACERGCDVVKGKKEIYIPWKNFNLSDSQFYTPRVSAFELAKKIHPAWEKLSFGARKLHARNCYQVLGLDLKTPSKFIICYTQNGEEIGGTRTAIMLAKQNNIPVLNLGNTETLNNIEDLITSLISQECT